LKFASLIIAALLSGASSFAMSEVNYSTSGAFDFASARVGDKFIYEPTHDILPDDLGIDWSLGNNVLDDLTVMYGLNKNQSYQVKVSIDDTSPFDILLMSEPKAELPDPTQPKGADGLYHKTRVININEISSPNQSESFFGNVFPGQFFSINVGTLQLSKVPPTMKFTLEYLATAPVPEPASYALMFAGLGVIGFLARRRRQV
jgi:PEP-CTERM motif